MKESTIARRVLDVCRQRGWFAWKTHGSAYQLDGIPDVIAIRDGRVVFLEVKRPGGEPTPKQRHRMRQLESFGARCAVVESSGEAKAFLEQFS